MVYNQYILTDSVAVVMFSYDLTIKDLPTFINEKAKIKHLFEK
jgi:hypothetical protein